MKKFYYILIFSFISLNLTNIYSQLLNNYKDLEVEIQANGILLKGNIIVPNSQNKMPVVLIIAGSGPTDRNGNNPMAGENNSLKMIAEGLALNGIASLRYDKRAIGESIDTLLSESDLRFETYINDAKVLFEYLKNDKRFSKVIIAGHSEGSLIGMVVAKKSNADAYISISGMGRTFDELIREQLSGQPDYVIKKSNEILDTLLKGKEYIDPPIYLNTLFRPSVQPYLISTFSYKPTKIISELKMPILILQGKNDLQVKVLDAENLKNAQANAKLVLFDKMNHVLKDCGTDSESNMAAYSNPNLPLAENFMKTITDFIKVLK